MKNREMNDYLTAVGQALWKHEGWVRHLTTAQEVYDFSDKRYSLSEVQQWFNEAPPLLPSVPYPTGWEDPFFTDGFGEERT